MKTLYLPASDPQTCDAAAKIIREGGLVAIPTETVYGLGANGLDPESHNYIFFCADTLISNTGSRKVSLSSNETPCD